MKGWNHTDMLSLGQQLFEKIHRRKKYANPNHEIHFMARELDDWLVAGVQSMVKGGYTPRYLKRTTSVCTMTKAKRALVI